LYHSVGLEEKRRFFRRKIAENSDPNGPKFIFVKIFGGLHIEARHYHLSGSPSLL
jgi:hypothetical protein